MRKLIIIMSVLINGCKQQDAASTYAGFINDPSNNIFQQLKIGDIETSVKWLPASYRNIGDLRPTEKSDQAENDKLCYFDVRFNKAEGSQLEKAKQLYMDFDIQNDFVLVVDGDSILPAICQKIENGISGNYQYMVVFERQEDVRKDFTMLYQDKVFGIGTLAFAFRQDDINKIPALNIAEVK